MQPWLPDIPQIVHHRNDSKQQQDDSQRQRNLEAHMYKPNCANYPANNEQADQRHQQPEVLSIAS